MNHVAKEILELLESRGFSSYIVGGYVRDYLLGIESFDIDICTSATMRDVVSLLSGNVNQCNSLNIKKKELNIDITPFRIESDYQNRRPTTIFHTADLEKDLQRRDFTINTICMNKKGEIIDQLNGIKDLKQGVIRMVGNPHQKITEDPLRILRAIRFATILNFTLEETLYKEIEENGAILETLSAYRIKEELAKILTSPHFQKGLELLKNLHLCDYLGIRFKSIVYTKDICGMWAQLEIYKDFPFTKLEKKNIVKIQEIVESKVVNSEVIFEYGLYLSLIAGEILGIEADSIHTLYKNMSIHSRKDLVLSFEEIRKLTLFKPAKIREVENRLIKEVVSGRLENNKNKLKDYILKNKTRW